MLEELESTKGMDLKSEPSPSFSYSLKTKYRELLRTHIIMGVGSLTAEREALVDGFVNDKLTSQQVMHLHLQALQQMIDGLGNRSTHHVMSRADLLILELIMSLAERYQTSSQH